MSTVRCALLSLVLAACGGPSLLPDGGPLPDSGTPALPDGGRAHCDAVAQVDGLTLHVDPVGGDDAQGTGSATASGAAEPACAYRTITRALALATAAPRASMHLVVDVTSFPGSGETFPLVLPAGTSLAAASGAVVALQVSGVGVRLPNPGASLEGLVLDGAGSATEGVVAAAGGLTLAHVELKGFTTAAVRAEKSAVVTVTGASRLHQNGIGLLAVDSAAVTLDASSATLTAPLEVSGSAGNGIEVRGAAHLVATGTRSGVDPGQGTLRVTDNAGAGLLVQQVLVAKGSAGPAGSTLSGVVLSGNRGSGLQVFGGSGVTVRGSYLSANAQHGLAVQTDPGFVSGGSGANDGNDLSRIDLGAVGTPGGNLLQDAAHPNAVKGVCLDLSAGGATGGLLKLAGNVFATGGSNVDCAQLAASLPATGDCAAQGPLGDVGRNPKNDFDLGLCTVP